CAGRISTPDNGISCARLHRGSPQRRGARRALAVARLYYCSIPCPAANPFGRHGGLLSQGLKLLRVGAIACAAWTAFAAAQDIKFALDWKFEGQSAPYFVAIDKGYYGTEGLNVAIDSGPGSVAGIARVAAGTYPLGLFDINSLIKLRDQ